MGPVAGNVLGRAVKQIDAALDVRRDQAGAEVVHDAVAECLEKRYLACGLFKLVAGSPPALREKVGKEADRTESENVEADDVLKCWQVRPHLRRGRNVFEERQIH